MSGKIVRLNRIVNNARSIGLDVDILQVTPGDGNCFYHAMIENLSVTDRPYNGTHYDLRQEVVSFVDQNRQEEFIAHWQQVNTLGLDLDALIRSQYLLGTFANELFIRACAIKLNVVIFITMANSRPEYPFEIFWPTRHNWGLDLSVYRGLCVAIGHGNDHFQSLCFLNGSEPWSRPALRSVSLPDDGIDVTSSKASYSDVLKKRPNINKPFLNNTTKKARMLDGILSKLMKEEDCVDFQISQAASISKETTENKKLPHNSTKTTEHNKISQQVTSNASKTSESKIRQHCDKYGIDYLPPVPNESITDIRRRRGVMRGLIRQKENNERKNISFSDKNGKSDKVQITVSAEVSDVMNNILREIENKLKSGDGVTSAGRVSTKSSKKIENKILRECNKYGIDYLRPLPNESSKDIRSRRGVMRGLIRQRELEGRNNNSGADESGQTNQQNPAITSDEVSDISNNFLHENEQVYKMINQFNEGEDKHTILLCKSCKEIRPSFHATSPSLSFSGNEKPSEVPQWVIHEDGRCTRCFYEMKKKMKKHNQALKFSGIFSLGEDCYKDGDGSFVHNNQHFSNVPSFLKGLTFIETLLIRKISIAVYVHTLKYGMLASKGHAVAVPHDLKMFTKLPQLPEEVGVLLLRNDKNKSNAYMASRQKVQQALEGLVFGFPKYGVSNPLPGYTKYQGQDHCSGMQLNGKYFLYEPNRYYCDVTIEEQRLNRLPQNHGDVDGLPMVFTKESINDDDEDLGPGPSQFDTLELEEEVTSCSGFSAQFTFTDADKNVKKALQKFLANENSGATIDSAIVEIPFNVPQQREKPIPELSTEGFFCQAYPHIFCNGSCDITIKSLHSIDFSDWVSHIYFCKDNRVPAHRFLKFHLLNIAMRQKALNQGSFCVNQQLNDKHLTIDELKQKLEENDQSIPRKFISMSANLPNTDPFWRERKFELDALCFFMLKEHNVLPTYFDTSSCAENHWQPLHQLLIKYVSEMSDQNFEAVKEKFNSNPKYRHQILLENQHIVTSYFDARHMNYKNTVLKELFQYEEDWHRHEFAKSRGQIHSHALYFSKKHYDIVRSIMEQDTDSTNKSKQLEKWLQSNECNGNNVFSPMFVSMHPAGGAECIDDNTGQRTWAPNKDNWAPPEGSLKEGDPDVLKRPFSFYRNIEELKQFHKHLVNKVLLHKCSGYCLRRKTVKTDEKDETGHFKKKLVRYCRFHFGDFDETTKKSKGKKVSPFCPKISEEKIDRYEGCNDHPRMVQHIRVRALSWLGQCDSQPIISQNIVALLKYITGYLCKGAPSTKDLVDIYSGILDSSESNATVRSVAQRLFMKTVGNVDTPSSAADFINIKGKLVHCSRRFRRIGLSGFRLFNSKGNKDGNVTNKTPLDVFLSDERRKDHPEITLYDWSKTCNCSKSKSCGKNHVPVFTGCPTFWVWPVEEDFAKALLMQFSKGTWMVVEDLKEGFESYTEAFAHFLDTDECPEAVRIMLKFAKLEYDKKVARKTNNRKTSNKNENDENDIDLSQSTTGSQLSQSSQCSIEEETMGFKLMKDIAATQKNHMQNAEVEDEVLHNGGNDYDWYSEGMSALGLDDISLEDLRNWLPDVSEKAGIMFDEEGGNQTLPDVNPRLVNYMQMQIVHYNLNLLLRYAMGEINTGYDDCKRLIVQGCAGTGKSQVIKILTRLVRRLFGCNRSVLNVAPTGAAAVLLPDGGTVHSTIHVPQKAKKSSSATLSDHPMSTKRMQALKNISLNGNGNLALMCINADERGMIGQSVLAWFHQRFTELSISLLGTESENIFGCIPSFNFFGDIFQLGAIGERNLYDKVLPTTNPIDIKGNAVYNSFTEVIVLSEVMRQKPDQIALLERLNRIRTGNVTRLDWENINKRSYGSLSVEEKQNFDSDGANVICLTETWNEAKQYNRKVLNSKIIAGRRVVSAEIPCTGRGKHHMVEKESMGQIPNVCIAAVGCRVILTKNQGGLTRLGLNNGAIGIVVSILYEEDQQPPSFPIAIIVDFPKYKGPKWNDSHPTWVPITVNKVMCKDKCCHREGLPLITGYAITIAKSQGMTIGAKELITNVIIKLSDSITMEKLNYGTAYTAFSRCTEEKDWCLADPISFERLEYLNRHGKKKNRQEEEHRLIKLSEKTIRKHACSVEEYMHLLSQIDAFCSDGLNDAVCLQAKNCSCVYHHLHQSP